MNHAVQNSMEGLIQGGYHPSFFLFLDINPSKIDVNIHPTKTEIKFEDERHVYAIIRSSIKHSIGQYNIAPSLDFSLNPEYNMLSTGQSRSTKTPIIQVNPDFNPFDSDSKKSADAYSSDRNIKGTHWQALFEEMHDEMDSAISEASPRLTKMDEEIQDHRFVVQIKNRFIFTQIKSGILIIDQEKAHERILYEKYCKTLLETKVVSQSLVIAIEVILNQVELDLFKELSDDIASLGFDFTTNETGVTFHGSPVNIPNNDLNKMVSDILQSFQENQESWKKQKEKAMAKRFAKRNAIKLGRNLQVEEMNQIIDELFSCEMPFASINNKPTAIVIELNELIKRFN
jgi:DNA mismatch repair protein MutL